MLNSITNMVVAPEVAVPGLIPILHGNTANGRAKNASRKADLPEPVYYKRPICATAECVSCPYARENGSC